MEQSQSKKTPKWKIKATNVWNFTLRIFKVILHGLGRFLELLVDLGEDTEGASWFIILCVGVLLAVFPALKSCEEKKEVWTGKHRVTKLADLSQLPSTVVPWDIDTLDLEKEDNKGLVFIMRGSTNTGSYNLTTFKIQHPKRVVFTKSTSSQPSLWIRLSSSSVSTLYHKEEPQLSHISEFIDNEQDTIEIKIRKDDIPRYVMISGNGNRSKQEDI